MINDKQSYLFSLSLFPSSELSLCPNNLFLNVFPLWSVATSGSGRMSDLVNIQGCPLHPVIPSDVPSYTISFLKDVSLPIRTLDGPTKSTGLGEVPLKGGIGPTRFTVPKCPTATNPIVIKVS